MTAKLNNAQIEILNLFSTDLSEAELAVLRQLLIEFRYWRLQNGLDQLRITPETLRQWGNEHLRTPYASQNANRAAS